jgi:DNA-binding winged helix-turn-helix (wHTH) protein
MAVPQFQRQLWRLPGCGDECKAIRVIQPGLLGRAEVVQHDPLSHETWGRLNAGPLGGAVVRTGVLVVDRLRRTVHVEGREIATTAAEWAILDYLAGNVSRICPHREILTAGWGEEWIGELHLLRVNLARLRNKVGPAAPLIETCKGRGYRLRLTPPIESERITPLPPKPWAKAWDRCRDCGRDDRPHGGHGRCNSCAGLHARRKGAPCSD